MTKKTLPKWDKDREAQLVAFVEDEAGGVISLGTVDAAAEELETTSRSVASKLRKMGYEVESAAKTKTKAFTDEEEENLRKFVTTNAGKYTYAEIATILFQDPDKTRSVQGKLLSMELTDKVKRTEPKIVAKTYSEEEENTIADMVANGSFLEDIADALGRTMNSVRGKALSMLKTHGITMPKQKISHAKAVAGDAMEALGDISELSVEDIAEKLEKSVRGVKVMLTHRGISCANYDGAKKAEKIAEKKAATAE